MSKFDETSPRRVIPRWRAAKDSAGAAERIPLPAESLPPPVENETVLSEALQAWSKQPSLGTALDLLSSAQLFEAFDVARSAAKFVLKQRELVPALAAELATSVLARRRYQAPVQDTIRGSKSRLRSQINNPLLLVDLARHYSSIGQKKKASRYMHMALRFAPNHRFVLRAASRLFVHLNELDRAQDLLAARGVTQGDPWLMAAEISVASVADRKSRFIKRGAELLKSARFPPDQLTELSSALATVELNNGKTKVAKQLFSDSLVRPNDNVLAQAEWAMRTHKLELPVAERVETISKTFETDFWLRYQAKDLGNAKVLAEAWRADEPFSVRPAIMGQFTACLDEDYELARRFTKEGLIANPQHPQLIQNLVFLEAMTGHLMTAWSLLSHHYKEDSVQSMANLGLIAYRSGNIELGRRCYEFSIRQARKHEDPHFRAMAEANYAREAFLAKDPEASKIIRRATETIQKAPQLIGAQLVWARTQRYLRGQAVAPTPELPVENLEKTSTYRRLLDSR